jgi:hypothetical protein
MQPSGASASGDRKPFAWKKGVMDARCNIPDSAEGQWVGDEFRQRWQALGAAAPPCQELPNCINDSTMALDETDLLKRCQSCCVSFPAGSIRAAEGVSPPTVDILA